MGAVYEACRSEVAGIREAYEALLDRIEGYERLLAGIDSPSREAQLAVGMQATGAKRLRELLETEGLDALIRFADRVIRIRHWEDGTFL